MKRINGYDVTIFKGTGTYRVANPYTGEWKDYNFGNESPQNYADVELQIDSNPDRYSEDVGNIERDTRYTEREFDTLSEANEYAGRSGNYVATTPGQNGKPVVHEKYHVCPPNYHWVRGHEQLLPHTLTMTTHVDGHCARNPRNKRKR